MCFQSRLFLPLSEKALFLLCILPKMLFFVRVLSTFFFWAGLATIAVLSVLEQAAARMFLWPWCIAYVGFCGLGWLVILCRWSRPAASSRGLGRGWTAAAALLGSGAVVCALASPFRAELGIWLLVPLGGIGWFFTATDSFAESNRCRGGRWSSLPPMPAVLGLLGAAVSCASLALWGADQAERLGVERFAGAAIPENLTGWLAWWFAARNSQPLGHVNYTGGTALLFLPWLLWLAATASQGCHAATKLGESGVKPDLRRSSSARSPSYDFRRLTPVFWLLASLLCLVMLLSSGSRGAWLGSIVAVAGSGFLVWRLYRTWRRRLLGWGAAAGVLMLTLAMVHPALRSSLRPRDPGEIPNASNAERRSMLSIGWRMGLDRPLVGWGIGAVPLAYDAYRGAEDYGPINMLQVHNTPLNLWAEGGVLLVGLATVVGLLCLRGVRRALGRAGPGSEEGGLDERLAQPCWPAAISLLGYGAFALTDYQLDLPIVAFVVAVNCGAIAACDPASPLAVHDRPWFVWLRSRWGTAGAAAALLLGLVFFATPWLLARRALAIDEIDEAVLLQPHDRALRAMRGLLAIEQARGTQDKGEREQLRQFGGYELAVAGERGAHAELVQFNLGWLALEKRPKEACAHFRAVLAITPARSGAWLGLALAKIKLGDVPGAIDALGMETIVNPGFLASGWWLNDSLAPHRPAVMQRLQLKLTHLLQTYPTGQWPAPQALYFRTLIEWLQQQVSTEELVARSVSAEQRLFWQVASAARRSGEPNALHRPEPLVGERENARGRLALQVRRILGQPAGMAQIDNMLEAIGSFSPEELVRHALQPVPGSPWPILVSYSFRAGFGVRQRNPYAQRVRDGMPELRSPLAEAFVQPALLPPGWLYDRDLRALADCESNGARLEPVDAHPSADSPEHARQSRPTP